MCVLVGQRPTCCHVDLYSYTVRDRTCKDVQFLWKNVFLHSMTFDPYFDPLNGKISLGNTPSPIQHIEMIQKKYVNCFSPKMPHTFTFSKICTRLMYGTIKTCHFIFDYNCRVFWLIFCNVYFWKKLSSQL